MEAAVMDTIRLETLQHSGETLLFFYSSRGLCLPANAITDTLPEAETELKLGLTPFHTSKRKG